ncbi:MAG: polysaccharide biosynthesis tyrosine autokinase [Paludibacteraceae bacterium]|nr:polysaccharide biosynthesis tyrosine autokinase [Paludibacteraceae bacterium]
MANTDYTSDNRHYTSDNHTYASGNGNYIYGHGNAAYGNGIYGNGAYGNGAYGNGNYGNGQYNGQYYNNYNDPNQQDEPSGGGFDIMEWVLRIIHYWYFFLIAAIIAYAAAYVSNRKWKATYYSQGTIILRESGNGLGSINSPLMQGFGLEAGYNNLSNQLLVIGSYDLMSRVVDSLPFFRTEYLTKGRFKSRNLFHSTPILVETTRIDPRAYGQLFAVTFHKDGTIQISSENEKLPLDIITRYGEPIDCNFFAATIWPTENMISSGTIYFRFRSRETLIEEFQANLRQDWVSSGSSVLALALVSDCPERDCEFIDKLMQVFILKNLESKNEMADRSIAFINEQLIELQKSLQLSEAAMTDFRQENKLLNVSSYAGQIVGRLNSYDQQSMTLRLRETYFDYLINYVNSGIDNDAVIAPGSMGISDATLTSLVNQLNTLRLQRGELTEKNVYYAKYTKDMQNVKESIAEVIKSMRASLEIEKSDLALRYSEAEADMRTLPEKELQMVAIERQYRIDDNYYTFFLQKRAEAEIQKASNTPDNKILDKARTTMTMNAGEKKKKQRTFVMIGLLIPLLAIVLSELLNNKVRTPKEAAKLSAYHLIGTTRHARSQNPTLVRDHPRSSYAETMRAIRTRIEFVVKRKDKVVLCVTSTESGDGKTFLSTNLAALYATSKRRTLLLDLDVRKPNIHTKLGLENGKGVTNYLIDECEFEDIIQRDTPFGFDFVRAGTIPPNPGELMHSEKLAELLKQLREEYDYIIIDTSPIGLVPDAYSIVEASDICLFVIRCLRTNKTFCRETLEQVSEVVDNKDKIQLILSDVPNEGFHRGYRYGNGYGYGYGQGGGYGYGYGYGYGTGGYNRKRRSYSSRYGKYYSRYFHPKNDDKNKHYYAEDDDEV